MPANINNVHWIFFAIDFTNNIIFVYNSSFEQRSVMIDWCISINKALCDVTQIKNLSLYPAVADCQKQFNSDDCGIHMLKEIEHIVLGFCCFPLEMEMKELRSFMALQLLKEKIDI